jgi:hypothetical protein
MRTALAVLLPVPGGAEAGIWTAARRMAGPV